MKTKGIGYVRVSTDKQADRGVSLEAQVEKIRAMATVHDVELLDVLVDAGESAKDLDRPGMVRILEMVQSRAVGIRSTVSRQDAESQRGPFCCLSLRLRGLARNNPVEDHRPRILGSVFVSKRGFLLGNAAHVTRSKKAPGKPAFTPPKTAKAAERDPGGCLTARTSRLRSLPPPPASKSPGSRLRPRRGTYGAAADRRWLESLVDVLFSARRPQPMTE
jgi:hypothetical protein